MHWKRILIIAAIVLLVLAGTVYIFLSTSGLNLFKPMIAQAVKEATGRELKLDGNISVRLGLTSIITADDIKFENASWGSQPHMATIKRFQASIKLLPLLTGKFACSRLTILEPDIILETNSSVQKNFDFDLSRESGDSRDMILPVLVFNDIVVKNGRLSYRDGQSDKTFSLNVARLDAVIPGLDKSLDINLDGTINDNSFSVDGKFGPVLAWLEPDYSFPVELAVWAGNARLDVDGEIRNPMNFSNLTFNITARGPSTRELAEMVGVNETPELGAFELEAKIADTGGRPVLERFNFHSGSEELVAVTCKGAINDLKTLQRVFLDFAINGENTSNLTESGLPELPVNGPFHISGHISDPESGIYSLENLKIILADNIVNGQIDLNTTTETPFVTADMVSERFDFGRFTLAARVTGLTETPALENMDLKVGIKKSTLLKLSGGIKDLLSQEGIEFNFSLQGEDIGDLKDVIGRPVPVKGNFKVTGQISDVDKRVFQVTPLEIVLGDNRVTGRVDVNLAGPEPDIRAEMSAKSFNLRSILIEGNETLTHIINFEDLGPIGLNLSVSGSPDKIALDQFDFRAGSNDLIQIAFNGSVAEPVTQKGVDLFFDIQGKDIATLKDLVGKEIPAQGAFSVSGHITDPGLKNYKISDLKLSVGETRIDGWMDLTLAEKQLRLLSELSSPNFMLRPLAVPAVKQRTHLQDLGPFKFAIDLTRSDNSLNLHNLDFRLGTTDLIEVTLNGKAEDITTLKGVEFDFLLRGEEIGNLFDSKDRDGSLKGVFEISGRISEPEKKIIRLPLLKIALGDNAGNGSIELDLSQDPPYLKADFSSKQFDLRPFLASSETEGASKREPVKTKEKVFSDRPWHLEALKSFNADVIIRNQKILLPALALEKMKIDATLKNGDLSVNPIQFIVGGGIAEGDLQFDTREENPALDLTLHIDQVDIGPMLDELGYKRDYEGRVDVDINLSGAGRSTAEQMAGLNGDATVIMVDGMAKSKHLDILQKYLGTDILRMLNPFDSREPQTPINCLVTAVDIKDGLADLNIVLDTDKTTIFCAGNINLAEEKLDLGLKPVPKKGFGTKDAKISFSLNDLSQPFGLGGTLANPLMVLDVERSLFEAGKFAGAMLLGPVGIAAFFADVSIGKADPCEKAIEEASQKAAESGDNQTKEEINSDYHLRDYDP